MSTKRHQRIYRDTIQGITRGDFRRLFAIAVRSTEAGRFVEGKPKQYTKVRMAALLTWELRAVLKIELEDLLKKAADLADHGERKTVTGSDIKYAAELMGSPAYFPSEEYETIKNMKELKKKVKKATDGFYVMGRAAFVRLMREIIQDHHRNMRVTKQAIANTRFYIEDYLKKVLVVAIRNMITLSDRSTLMPKDINMARYSVCRKY